MRSGSEGFPCCAAYVNTSDRKKGTSILFARGISTCLATVCLHWKHASSLKLGNTLFPPAAPRFLPEPQSA